MTGGHSERVRHWLMDAVLPLWADVGVDREGGGFVERLTLAGAPDYEVPKRVRVQARQVYVYAHAAVLGLAPSGLEIAWRGYEFLKRHAWLDGGGVAHLLDRRGAVLDARRDSYDHAFVLLAFAWLFRASRDEQVLAAIENLSAALDRHLRHPHSGYRENDLPDVKARRQNPHMHLLEAFLSLYAATGEDRWLVRAREIVSLFRDHFFRPEGMLFEYFDDAWHPAAGGQVVEPGHHFEWVWLLSQLAELAGESFVQEGRSLMGFALRHGVEVASGLAYDEVYPGGGISRASKRCWPQTEFLKAELALGDRAGTLTKPKAIVDGLFAYYLDQPARGLWNDVVDADNRPIATSIPASTLYHVFLALTEYLRLGQGKSGQP